MVTDAADYERSPEIETGNRQEGDGGEGEIGPILLGMFDEPPKGMQELRLPILGF